MNTFRRENLDHIQTIFEQKTGTALPRRRAARRPLRIALIVAASACLLTMTVFADSLFSPLSGDELCLRADYEGDGVISVWVENQSDKELRFQPTLKLMRWSTSEEIEPITGQAAFRGASIPAHSSGTLTVDLSAAYDIDALEAPLAGGDWYYLVLTNNNFVFGHDWMCAVEFAEPVDVPAAPLPPAEPDPYVIQDIPEELRFYFETIFFDPAARRELDAAYVQAYTALFAAFEGNLVPSVSPVLPGNRISADAPYLTVQSPDDEPDLPTGIHWRAVDADFKLLAANGEHALTISAELPLQNADASRSLPLFYVLTYDKSAIASEEDGAFVYGRLLRFADLAPHKIYEDERYVCYEVSGLIYSDLEDYAQRFAEQNPDVRLDETVTAQIERFYRYYQENLSSLLCYRDAEP